METSLVTMIRENWSILVAIVGVIWSYASLNSKVKGLGGRVKHLEVCSDKREEILLDIQTRLASIETSLTFIKERIK